MTPPVRGRIAAQVRSSFLKRIERSTQPYPVARLADSLLVVAPHPDDEVLGCGGLVHLKRAAGARVTLVVVTDGSTSHRRFIGSEELRSRRRNEAYESAARLGLDPSDVFLLDFPDGMLTEHLAAATEALREVFTSCRPSEIAIPHVYEPPADHQAASTAALRAAASLEGGTTILEYGVWIWRTPPIVPLPERSLLGRMKRLPRAGISSYRLATAFNRSLNVEAYLTAKRYSLEAHATQVTRAEGYADWPILSDVDDGAWLASLLGPHEYFRESRLGSPEKRLRVA